MGTFNIPSPNELNHISQESLEKQRQNKDKLRIERKKLIDAKINTLIPAIIKSLIKAANKGLTSKEISLFILGSEFSKPEKQEIMDVIAKHFLQAGYAVKQSGFKDSLYFKWKQD